MRKKKLLIIGLLLLLLIIGVGYILSLRGFREQPTLPTTTPVISPTEFLGKSHTEALQSLGIKITGFYKEHTVKPSTFHPAQLASYTEACTKGGYDLSAYLDQSLTFTGYRTDVTYEDSLLYAWVVSSDNKIICIYLTVTEDSTLAPGIFSVNNPFLRFNAD